MDTTVTAPPARRPGVGRIVAGAVVGVVALAVGAAGVTGIWAITAKSNHTYISTGTHHYSSTTGRAIVSDPVHVGRIPEWLVARIRITTASSTGAATFVGVARKADVDRYLARVAHSTIEDVDYSPFSVAYGRVRGSAVPARPASQRFWAASSAGTGSRSLTWNVREGQWRIVVMNADGSPNVTADAKVGASVAHALVYSLVLLGIGIAIAALAAWIVISGSRARRA